MASSILTWALGWSAGKLANSLFNFLTNSDLERDLSKSVEKWIKSLPNGNHAEVLFIWNDKTHNYTRQRGREALSFCLENKDLPDPIIWFNALKDRFIEVQESQKIEDRQPFFKQSLSEAESDLIRLSESLYEVCKEDESFFKNTMIETIKRIDKTISYQSGIEYKLRDLSSFINDKRVLYISWVDETKDSFALMGASIDEIRKKLSDIIPAFVEVSREKLWIDSMQGACRYFRNSTKDLPLFIRTDFEKAIIDMSPDFRDKIKDALINFRNNFTEPMLFLFCEFKVNCPGGILHNLYKLNVRYPPIIYYSGLPLDPNEPFSIVDYNVGFYLKYATLAEKTIVNGEIYEKGTKLEFANPFNSSESLNILKAS